MKVVIIGAPRTGKSTLFRKLSLHFDCAVGTDDFMCLEWSAVPDAVIGVLEKHEDWILEGVNAARVLRRWLRDRKDMPKIDVVYYLTKPMAQQTNAHRAMSKSIATVWKQIAPKLVVDGTRIVREVEG